LLARHPADDRLLVIPWALAIAIYLAAFRKGRAGFSRGAHAFEMGREAVVVLALASLAFALRASWIETIPWTVGGDEGSQGLEARRVLAGSVRHFFGTGWLGVPNLQFCWQAVCLWCFGDNLLGLRLPWAMVGTTTVALSYLLVRQLFGGQLAALVACFSPPTTSTSTTAASAPIRSTTDCS
jgi:4-amino-4-deoxy-L-arabinose transferase-like glycosyltransferase